MVSKTELQTLHTDFNPHGIQLRGSARTANAALAAVTRNTPGEE